MAVGKANFGAKFRHRSGDLLNYSQDANATSYVNAWTKIREVTVNISGAYKIECEITANGNPLFFRVYKNGVGYGTLISDTPMSWGAYGESLVFNDGDKLQLYAYSPSGGVAVTIRNFRIYNAKKTQIETNL